MGCECMECKFVNVVRDNHEDLHPICVSQESDNFLKEIDYAEI